ncbi:hypothetical protein M3Y94_01057200 [Aphelenchoides besseyi]|nr:hypothetical protein M3Y94_01057200 [Aphelenchoides besseyi]
MILSLRLLFFVAVLFIINASASAHWPVFAKKIGWDQSTAVTGTIVCNGKPESGVRVRLFDHDKLDPDDKMGESVADSNGVYHVSGKTDSISTITPEVHIKFDCGAWTRKCYKFKVPRDYVTKGASPKKTYNAGVTELASVKPNC